MCSKSTAVRFATAKIASCGCSSRPRRRRSQADSIVAESARYNIGRATRTVNTPMRPLLFLMSDVQREFVFWLTSDSKPANAIAGEATGRFVLPADAWVVGYREIGQGAFVRTPQGKGLQVQGRFWIDPPTGRVLMSEMKIEDTDIVTTIDASYAVDTALGFSVPSEMRERYALSPDGMIVSGTATYSRFRQFTVQTDESLSPSPAR